ncbi:MAG TPA: hypothetical protein VHS03_02630 [Gaiellaceae bacterium]|nr:hypothetical protein [Gaiellaceae bacterium]
MRDSRPAVEAQQLVSKASRILCTANPIEVGFGRLIDEALPEEAGNPAYRGQQPEVFAPWFSELQPRNLAFGLKPGGPHATSDYRIHEGSRAIEGLVREFMGPKALSWLRARSEEARGSGYGATSWGASIGASFDGSGLNDAIVSYEWGPTLMDSLPAPLYRVARIAIELVPGLRPAFSTIHVHRSSGSQHLTFEMTNALRLAALEPLMQELGLGHHHGSLMSACGFVLGARFVLPPNTTTITLRPTPVGMELRLDVNLERLPDLPEPLVPLLQMQMAERPRSIREWHTWLAAFTQEGRPGPGSFSLLSIVVRPDLPARIALHLRPAVLDDRDSDEGDHADAWAGPESVRAYG